MHRVSLLQASLAAFCSLLFLALVRWQPAPLTLRLQVLSQHATRLSLLYGSETDISQTRQASRNLSGSPDFQTVRFPIDQPLLENFRLQQSHQIGPLLFRDLTIERFGGKNIAVSLRRLRAGLGLARLVPRGDVIEIQPAPDAGLTLLAVKLSKQAQRTHFAARFDIFLLLLLGLGCVAFIWSAARSPGRPLPQIPFASRTSIVALLIALYLVASLCGLNGSSTAIWRLLADRANPEQATIIGSPKFIRSDEWLVHTPWILSQCLQQPPFPLANRDIGDGPATLITSVPVRHWSMIFRPQYLGFFILPLEAAFAFYWNFKWFALLLGAFLFFELLTGGRSALALAGAAFIFFAGFVQWWFSSPTMMPEMIGMFFSAMWATAIIFRSRSPWRALAAAVVLLFALEQFIFCCYPRFQIPLSYLALFMLAGGAAGYFRRVGALRLAIFLGTLVIAGLLLAVWLHEVSALLNQIRRLVYPGQIFYTGGTYLWRWLAAPFLEFGMTEERYPFTMGNACEAAGYLFLFPLLLALLLRDALRRRFDPLLVAPISFAVLLLFYMCIGVPASFARWSGLSLVATTRANIALGIASAIALFRYLARDNSEASRSHPPIETVIFLTLALAYSALFSRANSLLASYIGGSAVVGVSLYFALTTLAIWNQRRLAACTLLLVPLLGANALVNPINRGLPAFGRSAFWKEIRAVEQNHPEARWLVLGNPGASSNMAQFVKSTGAQVMAGVRCNPDEEMIHLLDPAGEHRGVHSRYGHISVSPSLNQTPVFELTSTDTYSIRLPLSTGLISRLGATYLLDLGPADRERTILGFKEELSFDKMRLLRAGDSSP